MKSLCSHGMQMSRELIKPGAVCRTIGQVIHPAAALISMAIVRVNICERWNWLSLEKLSWTSREERQPCLKPPGSV